MRFPAHVEKLIFSLLQDLPDAAEIDRELRAFSPGDWKAFFGFIIKSGLFPSCCRHLMHVKSSAIPREYKSRLKQMYLLNLQRNSLLELELSALLNDFRSQGIEALPLKGPFLARYLYDDLALRRASADLDILVTDEQFREAESVLEKRGYVTSEQEPFRSFKLRHDKQLIFFRKAETGDYFQVELHTDLRGQWVGAPRADFMREVARVEIEGTMITVPSLENLLIYLSLVTMTTSEAPEVRYIYDVHTLLTKFSSRIDWQLVLEKVRLRHRSAVYFTLQLARELFQSSVPESFLRMIQPHPMKRLFLRAWINKKRILSTLHKPQGYYFFTFWHYFVTSYLYSENMFDCARTIWKKIFPPRQEVMLYYNKADVRPSLSVYAKRITKPVTHLWKNKGEAAAESETATCGRKSH